MQFISNDKFVQSKTVRDMKDFNSQSLVTQVKKEKKQIVSIMMPTKKAFALMCDDRVELFTDYETIKNKKGSYHDSWIEESQAKLLNQFNDDIGANLIMSRVQKQMKKQLYLAYISCDRL